MKQKKVEKYRQELEYEKIVYDKKLKEKEIQDQQEEFNKSFLSGNKLDRTMPLKDFMEEARNLSSIYVNYPEREILSMIWDSDRGLSPPKE